MSGVDGHIETWRLELTASGLSSDEIEELEDHLHDLMQELSLDHSPEEAFLLARHRIGEPEPLSREYIKMRRPSGHRLTVLACSLVMLVLATGYEEWQSRQQSEDEHSRAYLYSYLIGLAISDVVSAEESERIFDDVLMDPRLDVPLVAENMAGEIVAWRGQGLPDPSDRSTAALDRVRAAAMQLADATKRIRIEYDREHPESAVFLYYGSPVSPGLASWETIRGPAIILLLIFAGVTAWRICTQAAIRYPLQEVHSE